MSVLDKNAAGLKSRRTALEVLIKVEQDSAYANLALDAAFKRKSLSERDRAFATALVHGVLRNRLRIDESLSRHLKRPLEKLPVPLKNILRMALFQLESMHDVPQSAVLNTANELAKVTGHQGQARFVNGVLRAYLAREETTVPGRSDHDRASASSRISDPSAYSAYSAYSDPHSLSIQYSIPVWIIEKWIESYGIDETIKLLAATAEQPHLVLRACRTAITAEGLESFLNNNGFACTRSMLVADCLVIDRQRSTRLRGSPKKILGYEDGLFSIQDEASSLVSVITDPQPGQFVIDLCAAPGGKSLHLAELMNNTGKVLAVDVSASRLELLKRNRRRLGLTNIETAVADGRVLRSDRKADCVLLDAPCSGTGVINKRSDIRYNRSADAIPRLVELQRELLVNAASLTADGGILIYSTCSIEPEENEANIDWFLNQMPQFKPEPIGKYIPEQALCQWKTARASSSRDEVASAQWAAAKLESESEQLENGRIQLLPSRHGTSGFFIARLKKNATTQ